MLIDFSPVNDEQITLYEFSRRFSVDDLRSATHASLDAILGFISDANDAQVTFIPDDPNADDPLAPPEERYQGWSLAHLVMHVTASSEEWAGYSSVLARGIVYPREPRLRYETDWHLVTTRAQVLQRIEESRRMRLAYLDTFPDAPHLNVFRAISERFIERNGPVNAISAYLYGLRHEHGHFPQIQETARQACVALTPEGTC